VIKKPVYLIGYRATGKTTVGKKVAHELGIPFVDLDEYIKREAGREIAEIVSEKGWKAFRELEKHALTTLAAKQEPVVVSCGGGAVLHKDIWPEIKKGAVVVWLKARQETILARMAQDGLSQTQRPRLTDNSSTMKEEIEQTLQERYPLYEYCADVAIETDSLSPEKVARKIIEEVTS